MEICKDSIKKPLLCLNDNNIKALVFDKISPKISQISLPKFHIDETIKISSFILKRLRMKKKKRLISVIQHKKE